MPEVLDPIAAGVAAALKSLRTRSGLSEDRLAESDLAVDALAGLSIVRDFVAAGDTAEQAITRAVRTAAQTLDPTDSIVADVILALGLNPAEPELYTGDLGRRRSVLLDNWARLHELRSVPWQGPVPTPRALRFDVESHALSSLALALTSAESRIPSAEEPDSADDVVSRLRLPRGAVPLLSTEFRRVAGALRASLVTDASGSGWTLNLRKGRPTPLTTAYGIMTALLLEGPLAADLVPAVKFLKTRVEKGGPYAAENPSQPRPEAVAIVLDALHRVDAAARYDEQLAAMKRGLGDLERSRPLILSGVLETTVQYGDPELTRSLIDDLLETRRSFGGVLLWVQKAEDYLVAPVASVAHTARAVCALVRAQAALRPEEELREQVRDAVEQAAAWLAEGQNLDGTSEVIDRQVDSGPELVYVRHFTAAWVVKALTLVGLPALHPAVSAAVARIWQYYHRESALWRWPNGELPVWMTFDAVEALYLAAMAVPVPTT